MDHRKSSKSPLERLVEIQRNKTLPVKMTPKNRLDKSGNTKIVTPVVEDAVLPSNADFLKDAKNLAISNSSLVVNFNLNVDSKAVDKAFERSAEVAKKIAAAGAAMLGTALAFSNRVEDKFVLSKPKVALKPKVKVPNFKKI